MVYKIRILKGGKLVGGIVITGKGFTFNTENNKLKDVLKKIQKDGVHIMGGGEENGILYDTVDHVKVTNKKGMNELHNALIKEDFDWKVEQA